MLQLPLNIQLDDGLGYDNFFVGANQQLVDRLQSMPLSGQSHFIFVWGKANTGKTHLAQALAQQLQSSELTSIYLPCGNSAINSDILLGIEHIDWVCMDDLQIIAGQQDWESKLFNLYNSLTLAAKNLVIFSQTSPSAINIKLADLKSRLSAMEIYQLHPLDDTQKHRFLQQRAANRGLIISDEVASYILTRKERSTAGLVAIIDKLDTSSIALKRKVTIPLVKQIFGL